MNAKLGIKGTTPIRIALMQGFGAIVLVAGILIVGSPAHAQSVDHYQCYKVKDLKNPKFDKHAFTAVQLTDQFGSSSVDVIKPFLICNPVDKNGEGILNPQVHLCCYKIKGQKLLPRPHVEVGDQFGTLQLEAIKAQILCQPCSKTVIP